MTKTIRKYPKRYINADSHHVKKITADKAYVDDAYVAMFSVPGWFRKSLNKRKRAKDKNALRHGREPEKQTRDAAWLWW